MSDKSNIIDNALKDLKDAVNNILYSTNQKMEERIQNQTAKYKLFCLSRIKFYEFLNSHIIVWTDENNYYAVLCSQNKLRLEIYNLLYDVVSKPICQNCSEEKLYHILPDEFDIYPNSM